MKRNRIRFIGINGYDFPYTRVRCYNFSATLQKMGYQSEVLSFRDHLAPHKTGIQMLGLLDPMRLWLNLKALRILWKERDALFYVQKVHYHAAAPYLLYRLGRNRYVLDYDDWDVDRSPLFNLPLLNRMLWGSTDHEVITRTYARNASFCIASSRTLEKFLREENDRVYYVPTGVDTDVFRRKNPRPEGAPVVFAWTGQVWGKVIYDNVVFLLDCFAEVQRQEPNVQLLLVAGGDWSDKLRRLIADKYQGYNIVFQGWIHPDEVPQVLEGVDVGLLPLIPDAENLEWMSAKSPTKAFEYMAMEIPTVSTRFGEAEYLIREGVNGLLAGSQEEFAAKMLLLVRDRALRRAIGLKACRDARENYSLSVLGRQLHAIIEKETHE